LRIISPIIIITLTLIFHSETIAYNNSDTLKVVLEEIRVEVNRSASQIENSPLAISYWQRTEAQRLTAPSTGLEQNFRSIPGVYIGNRDNYSLGERLSIRGMGWRASFGVRGVQVLLDGIPLTAPDGQTILEIADPNLVRNAEIIRGPSSIFWGNGSGGTLYLSSFDDSTQDMVSLRSFGGSFGTHQTDATINTHYKDTRIRLSASNFETQGYREHSAATIRRGGISTESTLKSGNSLRYVALGVWAPDIQNPGSLNAAQVENDRAGANPMFITQKAGKSYTHFMHGIRYDKTSDIDEFSLVAYNTLRNLENPIQNTIINVDRVSGGGRTSYKRQIGAFRTMFSADAAIQSDFRENWVNSGGEKGNKTVQQREQLQTVGFAGIGQYNLGNISISGGIRYDYLYFKVSDEFDGATDASGNRTMEALSPQFGINYALGNATIFAGYSTAFESPTTTELANRPDEERGFNPTLNPERSAGFDLGLRGYLPPVQLRYEIVLYRIQVSDRINAFQTATGGDRNYFDNRGETRHQGAEIALNWQPNEHFRIDASHTYNDLTFQSNENNLEGNTIPGIPKTRTTLGIMYNWRFMTVESDVYIHDDMYANNENTVQNDGFILANLRISGEISPSSANKWKLLPFIQIRNITNETYNSSVSINAFGGRFFEPAAPRNMLAGLAFQF
jgi:iron complex outermembrane recepter protein